MGKKNTPDIRWLNAIQDIDREQWDELAVPLKTPLLEWQWLHDLEASGSIAPGHGWDPCHLTLWKGRRLIAAAPLYIKSHSDGEFTFDHWLAHLAGDFGITYFPKMVGMSPATPAVGYRFLTADDADRQEVFSRMLSAIDQFCQRRRISGCHLNFVDPAWSAMWPSDAFMAWKHQSYLWENQDYEVFDDYLTAFKSSQRRNIRRERRRMDTLGIRITAATGDEIPNGTADMMYQYYLRTNAQYGPWAARFLNGSFFKRIFRNYRHRMLIAAAHHPAASRPIALSMLLYKAQHLIGRYWGCAQPVKDLHFNMCFYAPIQWAIENGVSTFDPGAGSTHKIYRGFKAVSNISLHRFYDPRLKQIFQHLIDEVNQMENANIKALNRRLPFANRSEDQLA